MKLLYQRLTEYLIPLLPIGYRTNFYSWMENGKLINEGHTVTENGIEIAHIDYQATFLFHELPFRQINPLKLMILIQSWLNQQDTLRDVIDRYEDDFDLEILNDDTADLAFSIQIREPIYAREVAQGDIAIGGKYYELDPFEIWEKPDNVAIFVNEQQVL